MKAAVITQYGGPDVLHIREVEKPVPGDDHVLVNVRATSVNYNGLLMVSGRPFLARMMIGGLRKPKFRVPGNDIAGVVEAVGKHVTRFKAGDEVYGDTAEHGYAAWAEYVAVPESALARKPATLSFEHAAAVPEAALVAFQGLRDAGQVQQGQRVLIVGASGGIGTFAVQFAKHFGANVTAVCSERNADLVRSLGADHVIDYTREDFAKSGNTYDVILATAGYRSIFDYKRVLAPRGRYVAAGGSLRQVFAAILLGPFASIGSKQSFRVFAVKPNMDLAVVTELLESGVVKPVIERCYPFSESSKALAHYAEGRTRGKIVISLADV